MTQTKSHISQIVQRFITWLVILRTAEKTCYLNALVGAVICFAIAFVLLQPVLSLDKQVPHRWHNIGSMERAVGYNFCDIGYMDLKSRNPDHIKHIPRWRGKTEASVSLVGHMHENPALKSVPLREAAADYSGSLEDYCAHLTQPNQMQDPGLAGLLTFWIQLYPDASFEQTGYMLWTVRALLGVMAVFFLFAMGASPILGFVASYAFLNIDRIFYQHHFFSHYIFMPALLFFATAFLAYLIYIKAFKRWHSGVAWSLFIGVFIAFAAYFRISLLPMLIGGLLITGLFLWPQLPHWAAHKHLSKILALVVFAVVIVAGYRLTVHQAFDKFSLPPDKVAQARHVLTFHTLAHPVVIGLRITGRKTSVAKAEGIEALDHWLVKKIYGHVPTSSKYTPEYEAKVWDYYFSLWRKYPLGMMETYVYKTVNTTLYVMDSIATFYRYPPQFYPTKDFQKLARKVPPKMPVSLIFFTGIVMAHILAFGFFVYAYFKTRHPLSVYALIVFGIASLMYAETVATFAMMNAHAFLIAAWPILVALGVSLVPYLLTKKNKHQSSAAGDKK